MPLVIDYDTAAIKERTTSAPGMWRYAPLLPVVGVDDSYAADVGRTPVQEATALGESMGVSLCYKAEGSNPSGSFKDRGLAVGVALAAASGAKGICLPTQGNAGVAAALFCARLGLPAPILYMPEGHRASSYHQRAAHWGADIHFVGSNIAAAGKAMRADLAEVLASGERVDMSTFFEPGRLEGKKTMGLELAESMASLPDYIIYPTGGGTGLVGIWKAFQELAQLGVLEPPFPRMVAVQSAGCAPIVHAFERGDDSVTPIESQGTVADGLDVPGAIMGHAILQVLRDSKGYAVDVTEASIHTAYRDLARHGIASGYEGAATLAATRELRARRVLADGARVLLLVTSGPQGSTRTGQPPT